MRERTSGLVGRWVGSRTIVIASAAIFLVLVLSGALNFWPALTSFILLAGIAFLRGLVVNDSNGLSHVPAYQQTASFPAFATGADGVILNEMPDPVIVLEGSGRILFCNKAAERLVGIQWLGKHVAAMLRSAPLAAAIDEVLMGGEARSVDYSVPVPIERNYHASVTPIEAGTSVPPHLGATNAAHLRARSVLVVLRDVTEAHRVEAMRVDFVAFASHELKTPLTSLSGFIDTLRGHARDDPQAQERFLEIMADQAGRMRRLIDDLLSLSRIELREHVRPASVVDLLGVVNDVADGLSHAAGESGVEIHVTAAADLPPVRGDREELGQLVQNLADNALRYGRSGKRIELSLASEIRASRPMVRLSVRDFGEGISREHLPRLTERFYRVDAAASRAKGGTGLGLAIVKHIVNRHQGSLLIESEMGQGATFSVLIPAADIPERAVSPRLAG